MDEKALDGFVKENLGDDVEVDAIGEGNWGHGSNVEFSDGTEWHVCTDEEADAAVVEEVKNTANYFNSDFLAAQTGLPMALWEVVDRDKITPAEMQEIFEAVDLSWEDFAKAAADADGRGFCLAYYDHEELNYGDYFFYRIN